MPGGPEIAVILVIALLVLGPQQLPKAMRTLGNAMAEIRKISSGFQNEMRSAMDAIETQADEIVKPTPSATAPVPDPNAPTPGETPTPTEEPKLQPDPAVTEVVARNPAPVEPAEPVIDPADRAAG